MKNIYTPVILFLFVAGNIVNAQVPEWTWGASATGANNSTANAVCIDINGNSYLTGSFLDDTIIFGKDTLINTGVFDSTTEADYCFFVVKYDKSGNELWARNSAGPGQAQGISISADAIGNVYVTGWLMGTGEVTFGDSTVANGGQGDLFIVKYDESGNVKWAKSAGETGLVIGTTTGISTDEAGNSYVTGYFDFSPITFGNITLTNTGENAQLFVVKYDSSGNALWAATRTEGYSYNILPSGICHDAHGNTYIAGDFSRSPIILGNDTLPNAGDLDIFIAKIDPAGNFAWAKSFGGTSDDLASGISIDAGGNIYITGTFSSTYLVLGNDTLTNPNLPNYEQQVYVSKFDSLGTPLWFKGYGEGGIATGISTDASGNSFIIGNFYSSMYIFGSDTLKNPYQLPNFFVTGYDTYGNVIWAQLPSSDNLGPYAYSNGIGLDADDNVFIAGQFSDDALLFTNDTVTFNGQQPNAANAFIAKLSTGIATNIESQKSMTTPITIFPNPSTAQFYFKGVSEGSTIEIYNVLGQQIYSSPVSGDNYMVNLSNAAKGIYIFSVKYKTEPIQQGKIVVE